MAVNPGVVMYGGAELALDNVALDFITISATVNVTLPEPVFPDAHVASDVMLIQLAVSEDFSPVPSNAVIIVSLVEDADNVNGEYAVSGSVIDTSPAISYSTIRNNPGGLYNVNLSLANRGRGGTYRLVVSAGNNATNAVSMAAVQTGATANWHADTDGNFARGTLATPTAYSGGTAGQIAGICGRKVVVAGLSTSVSPSQLYGDQPNITFDVNVAGGNPATGDHLKNSGGAKVARVALRDTASPTTFRKTQNVVTPASTGNATSAAYNIDNTFPATLTQHDLSIGVGAVFGQSTIPSNERSALSQLAATHTGYDPTTQGQWLVFAQTGHAAGITAVADGFGSYYLTRIANANGNANLRVGSGLTFYKNSGLSTPGVGCFSSSAYSTVRRLFRRKSPSGTERAVPYLETYIARADGTALASKNITLEVLRHSDNTAENTQNTLTTEASGRIRWNYTVLATHTAFNRFKTARDTVDNESTAPATIPQADVDGANPLALSAFTGPYPVYPKHVKLTGRVYGSAEPTVTQSSVFGCNSEGWPGISGTRTSPIGGSWTGDVGQATEDANGAPTGVGRRSKSSTSSIRSKWSSEVSETSYSVVNASRPALIDVAGIQITTSTDPWEMRYGSYYVTLASSVGPTNGGTADRLQGTLGYPDSFQTFVRPSDPTVEMLMYGCADTSAQRALFGFSAASVYGFSGDSGNYGCVAQPFQWLDANPDLQFIVTPRTSRLYVGQTTVIQARMLRYLGNNDHFFIEPAAPLRIKVFKFTTPGVPASVVVDTPMTQIDTTTFEYTLAPGSDISAVGTYAVKVTGFEASGTRPADDGETHIHVGIGDDSRMDIFISPVDPALEGTHWTPGQNLEVAMTAYKRGVKTTVDSAKVALVRYNPVTRVYEHLHSDNTWVSGIDTPTKYTMFTSPNDSKARYYSWTSEETRNWGLADIQIIGFATEYGIEYQAKGDLVVVDGKSRHDKNYGLLGQVLAATHYKRESTEAWRAVGIGGMNGGGAYQSVGYVRDTDRLVVKGLCPPDVVRGAFKFTYNGLTYIEGRYANRNKLFLDNSLFDTQVGYIEETSDSIATWYIGHSATDTTLDPLGATLIAILPGTEEVDRRLTVLTDGQATHKVRLYIDRTPPTLSIPSSYVVTNGWKSGGYGHSAGVPMYRGEYQRYYGTPDDYSSGPDFSEISEPDGEAFGANLPAVRTHNGIGTSFFPGGNVSVRTTVNAPDTTASRRLRFRAYDRAGNYADLDSSPLYFTTLPAVVNPTIAITSDNVSPKTLYESNLGGTSYDDKVVGVTATLPTDILKCRNTNNETVTAKLISDTLIISGANQKNIGSYQDAGFTWYRPAGFPIITGFVANADANNVSGLALRVKLEVTDTYYRTYTIDSAASFDYNANKKIDLEDEPVLTSGWGNLNRRVYGEGYHDADPARVVLIENGATLINGEVRPAATPSGGNYGRVTTRFVTGTETSFGVKLYKLDVNGNRVEMAPVDGVTLEYFEAATSEWKGIPYESEVFALAEFTQVDIRATFTVASNPPIIAILMAVN